MNMNTIRAAAYARFSSPLQRDESIDAQVRAISEFAAANKYQITKIYADRAKSGTTDQRPEFLKMIADAKHHLFDVILVHKLDRFARDRYDAAIYRKELEKVGVKLVSVLENFDDDSPESRIMVSVIEGYNEYYSMNLRREVMKGLKENALSCRHTGGTPGLGYTVNPSTMKLEIDEHEAGAVRLIFHRYIEGASYGEIIQELNDKGYRTKRGKPFGKNSLYEILRNEKYAGVYYYNKSASKGANGHFNRHKSKPEDEVIRIDGGVPALISKADFAKAQEKMLERKQRPASFKAKEVYLLSGKIKCGLCGSSYAGNSRKAYPGQTSYVSYRCNAKNVAIKCSNPEVKRDWIESEVLSILADRIFDENAIPQLLERYRSFAATRDVALRRELAGCETELAAVEKGIRNIVDLAVQSGSAALLEKLRELEAQKSQLEAARISLDERLHARSVTEDQLRSAMREARERLVSGTMENRKALVEQYVRRITVFPERIAIELSLPAELTVDQEVER